MKKLIVLLIALLLVGGGALWMYLSRQAPVPASLDLPPRTLHLPGAVTGFTVAADPGITNPMAVTDSRHIAALMALLEGAEPSEGSGGESVARLTLDTPGETLRYEVWRRDQSLLLLDGEMRYILDTEAFFRLLNGLDGLYRYREHPVAALEEADGETPLSAAGSDYAYLRLDGGFAPSPPPAQDPLTLTWEGERLPTPRFSPEPQAVELALSLGEEEVFRGPLEEAAQLPLLGGEAYAVELTARYDSPYYTGEARYRYALETKAIPPRFEVRGAVTDPGEALVLWAHNLPEGERVECVTSLSDLPAFFPDGQGGQIALLPVSYYTSPGEYYVELRAGDASERFPVTVRDKRFEVQHLTVDPATTAQTIASEAANAEYRNAIFPLRSVRDWTRYWEGRFGYPVEGGEISTPFAVIRYTNGSSTPERHGAIDISLELGEPVYAPAAGRVLYAGYLQLTGNTVLIEHGLGLKTWYYHMNSLDIQTGEMARRGQKIGEVGSTGFSTGPHLHYGMSICEVFINPDTATGTELFELLPER